jgi:SnoaL-like domain
VVDVGPSTLDDLLIEREISSTLHRYCQTLDRRDWVGLRSCYHDVAVDSHGAFRGTADELVTWLRKRHEHVLSSMHVLSNISVQLADDRTSARVESYCLSLQVVDASSGDPFAGTGAQPVFMTVGCRYVDDFMVLPEVGWRISARAVAFEWMRREGMETFMPLDPAWLASRRDLADVLYSETVLGTSTSRGSTTD